jgi:RimJ/RimL family protein N-acetyltransferase
VEADVDAVLRYQSDPRYLRLYPWESRDREDVTAFVRTIMSWQYEDPRRKFQLAIVRSRDGSLIGNAGLRMKNPEDHEAELGFEIAPPHWGKGHATEAAQALLRFGFEQQQLHRVWATCLTENRASSRVLDKLGMQREGRLRENRWFKGRWWDTFIYGILFYEWRGASGSHNTL